MGKRVPYEEGGFINDKSGKATAKVRKKAGIAPSAKKGNPVLKKFH